MNNNNVCGKISGPFISEGEGTNNNNPFRFIENKEDNCLEISDSVYDSVINSKSYKTTCKIDGENTCMVSKINNNTQSVTVYKRLDWRSQLVYCKNITVDNKNFLEIIPVFSKFDKSYLQKNKKTLLLLNKQIPLSPSKYIKGEINVELDGFVLALMGDKKQLFKYNDPAIRHISDEPKRLEFIPGMIPDILSLELNSDGNLDVIFRPDKDITDYNQVDVITYEINHNEKKEKIIRCSLVEAFNILSNPNSNIITVEDIGPGKQGGKYIHLYPSDMKPLSFVIVAHGSSIIDLNLNPKPTHTTDSTPKRKDVSLWLQEIIEKTIEFAYNPIHPREGIVLNLFMPDGSIRFIKFNQGHMSTYYLNYLINKLKEADYENNKLYDFFKTIPIDNKDKSFIKYKDLYIF
jgi:hypothetical protein